MALSDAEILGAIYNNCDPVKPADKTFYVDCTEVRGGAVFARKLCAELSRTNTRIHALFTGHIGSGKSSELQHLADRMQADAPLPGDKRFFPIIVNMSEYLDEYDVTATDILLAIVAELGDAFRETLKIELKDPYLQKRWEELKKYLLSDTEANEGEITLGFWKTKFQRLRTDPTAREEVRKQLFPQTGKLLEEINRSFIQARVALNKHTPKDGGHAYSDFVLILDNLEKIQRLAGNDQGEESQRALFIESAPQLIALAANVVFTVPLSLARNVGNQLQEIYCKELIILPMVKTEHRGSEHRAYEKGREKLKEVLAVRMPPGVSLETVIEEDALDFLIQYSGGHMRNLLMFTREASLLTEGRLPITRAAARQAIRPTVNILSGSLRAEDWNRLAALELSEDQIWDNNDPDKRRLLENLLVLEYVNGDDEESFDDDTPWYAVNPFIRELRPFRSAVESLKAERAAGK